MRFRLLTGIIAVFGLLPMAAYAADCGGRLVRVSDGRTTTFDKVLAEAAGAPMIAIGERHGLKKHVGAAACFLENLDRQPGNEGKIALVVEHVGADKQPVIDAYRKDHPQDAKGLGEALQWAKSGWPAWPVYQPLYVAAFTGGNAIYGADQPKGTQTPSLEELAPRLGTDAAHVVNVWAWLMNEAHCNMLNEAQAEKFGRAQANRDLSMAGVVQSALSARGRVLFYSGREHSRKDVSVPFLVGKAAKVATFSIELQETSIGRKKLKPSEALAEAKGRFDYVWFIGKAPEQDVCAVFRRSGKGTKPAVAK